MSPGFFFFLPRPKLLCPEPLAEAMLSAVEVGWSRPLVYFLRSPLPSRTQVPRTRLCWTLSGGSALREGRLWRCRPSNLGAPWDRRRVTLGRWWGKKIRACWPGSRHSLDLQWLCQSRPPSLWGHGLCLSPGSTRRQWQSLCECELTTPAALWHHCWLVQLLMLLLTDLMTVRRSEGRGNGRVPVITSSILVCSLIGTNSQYKVGDQYQDCCS